MFYPDDIVAIVDENNKFFGCIGVVVQCVCNNVNDSFIQYTIDLINSYPYRIKCEECELCLIKSDKKERKDNSVMASKKLTGYKAVAVIKQCYGTYHFAIYDDGNVYNPGDKVLVSGINCVQTIDSIISPEEVAEIYNKNITTEVICKVDTSAYDDRVTKRKEAEKLKKEMDKIIKEIDETKRYEMYTSESPELKDMYEKYKKLVG